MNNTTSNQRWLSRATPTLSIAGRRRISIVVLLVAVLSVVGIASLVELRLGRGAVVSGWTLTACLIGLMTLGVRRRMITLPIGSVSTWTQVHLYLGLFASAVYFAHVPRVIADGMLEGPLSWLFLLCVASGVYGVYASRTLPRRITAIEGQCRFNRIGIQRGELAKQANQLLERLNKEANNAGKPLLIELFNERIEPFIINRRGVAYWSRPTLRRRRDLLETLSQTHRYLDDVTRSYAGQLAAIVRQKDDLDFQFALQLRLRLWVLFHALLSLAVISLAILHVLVVTAVVG